MTFLTETIGDCTVYLGDCKDILSAIPKCSVHAVITDPPYHLQSIVKRFGKADSAPAKSEGATGVYKRSSAGFMGAQWDGGDIGSDPEAWRMLWEVMFPGGHLLTFGGTRTYHRMVCAVEDAGFEIRDTISWLYGSGFPKSQNVSKMMDKAAGAERGKVRIKPRPTTSGTIAGKVEMRPYIERSRELGYHELDDNTPISPEAIKWNGWGTALKPAQELICMARKPLIGSVVQNVLAHGTGAINIDASRGEDREKTRITSPKTTSSIYGEINVPEGKLLPPGRWPANIVHDGSEDVVSVLNEDRETAKFFYCAKAGPMERQFGLDDKNIHPTIKPVTLMDWLCRMVTPPGGLVLDPFVGSGTTGMAAVSNGYRFIGIEKEQKFFDVACRRIEAAVKLKERLDAEAVSNN